MAGSWGAQLIGSGTTGGTASGQPVDCPGGLCVVSIVGTFNGATIKLQLLGPDGTTLLDAGAATTFTANGNGLVYLAPGQIQGTVVGGPPAGVFMSIARVVS